MTDREMLTLLYGALKAMKTVNPELVEILKKHLFKEESVKSTSIAEKKDG